MGSILQENVLCVYPQRAFEQFFQYSLSLPDGLLGFRIEKVHVIHIEYNLCLITHTAGSSGINTSYEIVFTTRDIKENFVAH
jgi:hypothetical protein